MAAFRTAQVDVAKLRDYRLNPSHPGGSHKARVGQSKLGLTSREAEFLRESLLRALHEQGHELRTGVREENSRRYVLDFELVNEARAARVRSAWFVADGSVLRLITCYIL